MAYRQAGVTDYNYLSEFNLVPVIFEGDKNVIDAFGEYHKALSALSVFVMNRASEIFNDEYARLEREKNDRQAAFLLALAASIGVSIPRHVITDQSWWPSLYGNYQSKVMGACDSIVKVEAQLTKAIIKIESQLTKTVHSTESQ